MRRRVVLVRHGESEWNARARWQGHGGEGLSDHGRAQAELTAAYLAVAEPDAVAIVSSDLARAVQTAEPTAERLGVPLARSASWREIDVGWWSGLTHEEIAVKDPDGYEAWRRGGDVRIGGGERPAELRARVGDALDALDADHPPGTVLVFTHGGCVRAAAATALGWAADDPPITGVGNTSVSVLVAGSGGWRLEAYNAVGHLVDAG